MRGTLGQFYISNGTRPFLWRLAVRPQRLNARLGHNVLTRVYYLQ